MRHCETLIEASRVTADPVEALVNIYAADLKRNGFIVVRDLVDGDAITALDRRIAGRFAETPFCKGQFSGETTKRFGSLLKRFPEAEALVTDKLVMGIAERILGRNCDAIQLNLTQAIEIHPGAPAQIPHRDQDMYGTVLPDCELCVNVMWPLMDFTAENGATVLWPESNTLHPMAIPELDSAIAAEMTPGSALIFLGSTLHCAGANRSALPRRGLVVGYSLGWLKQFENQYLAYPPEVAARFPRELAKLVGYRSQKPNLNNYEGRCPSILLDGAPEEHIGLVDNLPGEMADLIARYTLDPAGFLENAHRIMAEHNALEGAQ
jgi:ectoine hydroxylase-related dioxygenase (phytanoyl-CoA dioxygenase family)